jgi:hypothetical protein
MRSFRVILGSAAVCGCLFAAGVLVSGAAAQTAEPVGGPLQLLRLMHLAPPEAQPHGKLGAKSTARSSERSAARSAAKSSEKRHVASRRKPRSYYAVAERKRQQVESKLQAAAAPAAVAPPSDNAWPAAPTAMAADATTLAPVQQTPAPPPPQIVAPTAGAPGTLVVDGQTIQVASADEANEIDLAADDAAAARNAALGPKLAVNTQLSAVAESAAKLEPASAALVETQIAEVSTTSWILQVLAALGGAVAAGTLAWFLMRSAPPRVQVSE